MPKAIAFFPWIELVDRLVVRSIRLLPYERGESPGQQPHVSQGDIDGIFEAYALRKTHLVSHATLIEVGDWRLGQEINDQVGAQLFRSRELIAFSALAQRRLFRGHFNYCNFDAYALVVQSYRPDDVGAFSFFTRRRDGGANYVWDAEEFAFLKPLHVPSNAKVDLDGLLLGALVDADEQGGLPFEAIVEFNRANTDSADVPVHTEIVMVKSAFEFLFGINQDSGVFAEALVALVPFEDRWHGPMREQWRRARPKSTRPLDAWAREFCDLRGGAAHGRRRGGERFVWSERAHLAFASLLFPLLVKHRLISLGLLVDERASLELAYIEAYLMWDPFAPATEREHPWEVIWSDVVFGELMRRDLSARMDALGIEDQAP